MIKRSLALALACMVLVSSLGVSVSATTMQDMVWYNLLDYGTAVSSGNFFSVSGTREIILPVPVQSNLYYVDMVVKSTVTPAVTAIWESRTSNLNVRQISDSNTYRVYGSLPAGNYTQLKLKFTCASSSNVTILSCYVSASDVLYYQEKASVRVVGGPVSSFTAMASVTTPATAYMATGDYNVLSAYTSYIMLPNVINYDFIDVFVDVYGYSINSLSLYLGDQLIPFEVNYLNNSQNIDSGSGSDYNSNVTFEIMIRADLRGLNRNIDPTSNAFLVIEGAHQYSDFGSRVTVKRYSGFVMSNNIDPTLWYLRKIEKNFSTWFSSLQNHLTTKFNDLKTHLTTEFTDLTENLSSWFSTQFEKLDLIRTDLSNLVHGRPDQWSNANNFENDVATQETQIGDMIDVIETAPTVPLNDVQSQVGQMTDVLRDADYRYYEVLAVTINGNQQITSVLFAAFIFATIGFLLFGKR